MNRILVALISASVVSAAAYAQDAMRAETSPKAPPAADAMAHDTKDAMSNADLAGKGAHKRTGAAKKLVKSKGTNSTDAMKSEGGSPNAMAHDAMANGMAHEAAPNAMAHDAMSNAMAHEPMKDSKSKEKK